MIVRVLFAIALSSTVYAVADMSEAYDDDAVVFSFHQASDFDRWYAVNDGVMGGVSDGRLERTADGYLRFFGTVSLENNGGFASVWSGGAAFDLSRYAGLLVRVRGDGQRYALNVSTDLQIRAGSYRCKFTSPKGEWAEIYFPFSDFQATSFGVEFDGAPPLNTKEIRSLGFLISDKQVGPFSIEVDWIRAVATPPRGQDK